MSDEIPEEWRVRNPTLSAAGHRQLMSVLQHPDAPRWNFATGDRLVRQDLQEVDDFRERLSTDRGQSASTGAVPPAWMLEEVLHLRSRCWWYEDHIPNDSNLETDWGQLPTMTREDLAVRLERVVPHDIEDLSRLIAYDTSGTTGHAVRFPHHPAMLAKSHALAEWAFRLHGAAVSFEPSMVGCANICAQMNTYVFANPFSVWNDSTFVKVNLNENDWSGGSDSARRFLKAQNPAIVTSDPISLAEMIRWEIEVAPHAILSTAVTLSPELRARVAEHFGCPVIDWYSTTETGPIGCSDPASNELRIMPPDLFVEVVAPDGTPVADGELGEIAVTGGRNPFVPLFRYRTGDFARIRRGPAPVLYDLRGRGVVFFRASNGAVVNAVDVGRVMRLRSVFVQHQFTQHADGRCVARIRPVPTIPVDVVGLERDLSRLFGDWPLEVRIDERLGDDQPGGKVVPYVSEMAS